MNTIFGFPNVIGYGRGYKVSRKPLKRIKNFINRMKGKKAVIFFVEKKVPKDLLPANAVIPDTHDGIETDVIEVGEIKLMQSIPHRQKHRPLVGGISAMWKGGTAGTLGAIVFKNGKPHLLSNEHVFFPHWQGAKKGDSVVQPSPYDWSQAAPSEEVGKITYDSKIRFWSQAQNEWNDFDAHLVPLQEGIPYESLKQLTIGSFNPEPKEHIVGMEVQRDGRTNGYRRAKVLATDVVASIWIDKDKNLLALFRNQVFYSNKEYSFVNGGDSGSLVLDMGKNPVGLIFAASSEVAIGTPIKSVQNALGFTFEDLPRSGYLAICKDPLWVISEGKYKALYNVRVRKAPALSSPIVGTVKRGETVEIVEMAGENDGWLWGKIVL